MSDPWDDPTGPLTELASLLSIAAKDLAKKEEPDALLYANPGFDGSLFANFSPEQRAKLDACLAKASKKYGAALKFGIRSPGAEMLTVGANYQSASLDAFYTKDGNALDYKVTLEITVNKTALLEAWGVTHESALFKLFFFEDALASQLSKPLPELETSLLKDATGARTLILLIPAHPIELYGPDLAILGGDAVAKWADHLPPRDAEKRAKKIAEVHDLAEKTLVKWLHFEIHHLTPLQLNLRWKNDQAPPPGDAIAGALYAQMVTCSILYMAAVSIRDKTWTATFSSDKYLAAFEVPDAAAVLATLKRSAPAGPWKAARTIGTLATWVYDPDRAGDRLTILQNVIASSFQDSSPAEACGHLLQRTEEIFQRVRGGWKTFIGKKLDEYFAHVKEIEETIVATAKSYDEQVQSLTSTLIGNMLAAVAVIVGSFIAAMFKSPFDANVFAVGALTYFVYLAVFPIGFGLTSTYGRFEQSRQAFHWRMSKFQARLPETAFKRIVDNATPDREQWFKGWFWITATVYAVVALLFLGAVFVVPDVMRHWSDDFSLQRVSYGAPTGDTIPLFVHGEHFDKEKEIVATVGSATFTNAGSDSLKVHGSTVLVFAPRRADVAAARVVVVRQGSAPPKPVPLH